MVKLKMKASKTCEHRLSFQGEGEIAWHWSGKIAGHNQMTGKRSIGREGGKDYLNGKSGGERLLRGI